MLFQEDVPKGRPALLFSPMIRQVVRQFLHSISAETLLREFSIEGPIFAKGRTRSASGEISTAGQTRCNVRASINNNPSEEAWPRTNVDRMWDHPLYKRNPLSSRDIYFDPETGITVQEDVGRYVVSTECTLQVPDYERALSLLDLIHMKVTNNLGGWVAQLKGAYILPPIVEYLLFDTHRLADRDPQEFYNYMDGKGSIVRRKSRRGIDKLTVDVVCPQTWVVTTCEQASPEPITADSTRVGWKITFNMRLYMNAPRLVKIEYPLVAHNKFYASHWYPTKRPEAILTINPHVGTYQLTGTLDDDTVVRIPWYDYWKPNMGSTSIYHNYRPFLQIAVDDVNGEQKEGIDIATNFGTEKEPIRLNDEIVEYYKANRDHVFGYKQQYVILVYSNDQLVEPTKLQLDSNGMLIVPPLNTLRGYHIVFAERKETYLESTKRFRVLIYDIMARRTR